MGAAVHEAVRSAGLPYGAIARLGLGSPGTMDIPAGKLRKPVNLKGWDDFPIRARVSCHCGMPVTFANDADAAAYGEFWVGSGREFHSMILLTLGTGLGCGIIIGDLLLDGQHSHGGEFGHTIIDCHEDARVCGCGRRGHYEAYTSATAVTQRTRDALDAGRRSSLKKALKQGEDLTPLLVAQHAEAGDKLSLEIILETARYVAIGAVNLMHTIDPDAILFGGAMTFGGKRSPLGRRFLDRIKEEIRARAYEVPAEKTVIDFATLGNDAGFLGAAGIARMEYGKKAQVA
jgi:glucokinase